MKAVSLKRISTGHRITSLPLVYLAAHAGTECRCVMCEVRKADEGGQEVPAADLRWQAQSLQQLEVRHVVLSGGDLLRHRNLWSLCRMLRNAGIRVVLFNPGTLLGEQAGEITEHTDQLILSLDGTPAVHDRIRQMNGCAAQQAAGIRALLELKPSFPITARTVVQKHNCGELDQVVRHAAGLGLKGISFLAADVFSTAYNRPSGWDEPRISQIALSHSDLCKLSRAIEILLTDQAREFARNFILTSPGQLWDIYRHFKALLGQCDFPPVRCQAPWVSAVVDVNGSVRPCFFLPPYGNLHEGKLGEIINSPASIRWRRGLKVTRNEICRHCIASTGRAGFDLLIED